MVVLLLKEGLEPKTSPSLLRARFRSEEENKIFKLFRRVKNFGGTKKNTHNLYGTFFSYELITQNNTIFCSTRMSPGAYGEREIERERTREFSNE